MMFETLQFLLPSVNLTNCSISSRSLESSSLVLSSAVTAIAASICDTCNVHVSALKPARGYVSISGYFKTDENCVKRTNQLQ